MKQVKIAVLGMGSIGTMHATYLAQHHVQHAKLVAVYDRSPDRLATVQHQFGKQLKYYDQLADVWHDANIDAVLIATYHYNHPDLTRAAMLAGKHVLCEKPAGVYTKNVREVNTVAQQHPELAYGLMYNQRMNPMYQKVRELVKAGQIGELRRTNWIITDWYRSQRYYDSSDWRATWAGEGGGVLLNQDPHQLDLWQWICGMPERVMAFAYFGKRRTVEVETEVTAYVEYANGATGVFVTTTTETPGTNRFEIVGSRGKLVIENQQLTMWQTNMDETEWNQTSLDGFSQPAVKRSVVPVNFDDDTGHERVTQNFVDHILFNEPLIAPGVEGINGLTLSNAMYLSAWQHRWITLPLDEDQFLVELNSRRETRENN